MLVALSAPGRRVGTAAGGGGGGGDRTPLFASNWSNSTGSGSTALRDGTNWDDEDGGTNPLSVVASAGRFPSTNNLQSNHQNANDYRWCQEYALRGALSNGQFIAIRAGLYHAVSDSVGSQGWAASHFVEAAAVAGGGSDSANKWELLMGSTGDGTFPFAVGLNAVGFPYNYLSMGNAGGGDPAHLNKNTLYWIELKFTRTAANTYTVEMRVRNSAGTILYSTGDSLNNIYGWGGAAFGSGNNTNLPIDDAAVVKLRVGKNGGFGAGSAQYIHWGGFAATDDDWVGVWGSLTTDV